MGVAAEDVGGAPGFAKCQRAVGYLLREAHPARIQQVEVAGESLSSGVQLLDLQEEKRSEGAEAQEIAQDDVVKLVAVDGDAAVRPFCPGIFLIDGDPDQVRHELRQAAVVIALDPDHLDAALRVRELADVGQKAPVLTPEAPEVQIGEYVAEQNQPLETHILQRLERLVGPCRLGAQMQIGQQHSVVDLLQHALL